MTNTIIPAESSHAEGGVAEHLVGYFTAKSSQDREGLMQYYSRSQTSHNDGVLGWVRDSWAGIDGLYADYMPGWGEGRIYATRVFGDERSAVLFLTEGPETFGAEIRAICAVDLTDGKVTRWVDYWDSRDFGVETAAGMRLPDDQFPATFGLGTGRQPAAHRAGDSREAAAISSPSTWNALRSARRRSPSASSPIETQTSV